MAWNNTSFSRPKCLRYEVAVGFETSQELTHSVQPISWGQSISCSLKAREYLQLSPCPPTAKEDQHYNSVLGRSVKIYLYCHLLASAAIPERAKCTLVGKWKAQDWVLATKMDTSPSLCSHECKHPFGEPELSTAKDTAAEEDQHLRYTKKKKVKNSYSLDPHDRNKE